MSDLIQQVVITGLAASVSPLAVIACIDMLSFKNPIKNSLAYLLGFTLTLIALGMAVTYIFQIGFSSSIFSNSVKAYIDIGLGIVCLGLIFFVLKRRPSQKGDDSNAKNKSTRPRKAFIVGSVIMIGNASTLVIYISGIHSISSAKLGITDDVIFLALLTFITLITVILPILLYLISPQKAGKLLASIGIWLNKHSKIIGVLILAFFGFYLTIKGLKAL